MRRGGPRRTPEVFGGRATSLAASTSRGDLPLEVHMHLRHATDGSAFETMPILSNLLGRPARSVTRRDFMRGRAVSSEPPTVVLSCRTLYMRFIDAVRWEAASGSDAAPEYDPVAGEPPAMIDARTTADLAEQITRDLDGVRRLRLVEREWLDADGFGAFLAPIIAAFEQRGGGVESSVDHDRPPDATV